MTSIFLVGKLVKQTSKPPYAIALVSLWLTTIAIWAFQWYQARKLYVLLDIEPKQDCLVIVANVIGILVDTIANGILVNDTHLNSYYKNASLTCSAC